MKTISFTLAALGLAMLAAPVATFAAGTANDTELQAIASATVTADQAIAAAVKLQPGTVTELMLDAQNGTPAWLVTIIDRAGIESNVSVDATTGTAMAAADTGNESAAEGEDDDKGQPEGTAEGEDNDDAGA